MANGSVRGCRPLPRPFQACVLLVALALAAPVLAIHRQSPFLFNCSDYPGGDSTNPQASKGEPGWIAFESTSDLLSNGSTGRNIYLLDNRPQDVDHDGDRQLSQITNATGDNANPNVSSQGALVAFDSTADILGTYNFARQIFLWERKSSTTLQLTDGGSDSSKPFVNSGGDAVAFQSQADLLGIGSAIGTQIYLADLASRQVVQVTNAPGTSTNPVLDDLASVIVFESDAELVGPASGFRQIYMHDRKLGRTTQLTSGTGDSINPSTDSSGRHVLFQSRADLLANGSGGWQVFLLDLDSGDLRQITRSLSGDCFSPSLQRFSRFISFLSTDDLLGTGAFGQHLFLFDTATGLTFQVTKGTGTVTDHPLSMGNFVIFDSDEDIMDTGMTGRQVYYIDLFRREGLVMPKLTLGPETIDLDAGDSTSGSRLQLAGADWQAAAGLSGRIKMLAGNRDFNGVARIEINKADVRLKPVPVPGFGVVCLSMRANGEGIHDCDGGRPGGILSVSEDHNTMDEGLDPGCAYGCRDELSCPGFLPGPHVGDCKGPVRTDRTDFSSAGDMQLRLELTLRVSESGGLDGRLCTADDQYAYRQFRDGLWSDGSVPITMELSSGGVNATISDVNASPGAIFTESETGSPFECRRLEQGNMSGAELVGVFPLLDVPNVPTGLRDVILSMHIVPREGKPFVPCTSLGCKILTLCTTDTDCDDDNRCNGQEQCVAGRCVSGVPPVCDDGAICTADSCDPDAGCVNTPLAACCVIDSDCQDLDVCNGSASCIGGDCIPGTALLCDDGMACNGIERCDRSLGCVPGIPLSRFAWDGIRCQLAVVGVAVGDAPPGSLGIKRRMQRIQRVLEKARNTVELAANGESLASNLGRAVGSVRSLTRSLERDVRRGKADSGIGRPILDQMRELALRIEQVRIGAPF